MDGYDTSCLEMSNRILVICKCDSKEGWVVLGTMAEISDSEHPEFFLSKQCKY
jgi:hypothetical protein